MAVALPRVTRQQLKERERDWYDSGAVMSRAQGGHGRPAEALQPVKYMLEQTCITLSKAEAKLSGGNMIEDGYGGGGGVLDQERERRLRERSSTRDIMGQNGLLSKYSRES